MATYLLPESVVREDGFGSETSLDVIGSGSLQLTLGITRIVEQGSLELSLWGSADQHYWQLLTAFPQKFYCGTYSMLLDLKLHPKVRFLRAQWKMGRWTGGKQSEALFGFYLLAEQIKLQAAGAA